MGDADPGGEATITTPKPGRRPKLSAGGRRLVGILLLLVVNLVWVASAELTRYLFIDLNFKRPFFTTYVKSCMFTMFLIRSCIKGTKSAGNKSKGYAKLAEEDDEANAGETEEEFTDFEVESLTAAEFEPIQLPSDSDYDRPASPSAVVQRQPGPRFDDSDDGSDGFGPFTEKDKFTADAEPAKQSVAARIRDKTRRVKFAVFREVRRMPASIAFEARIARYSYDRTAPPCEECCHKSPFFTYMLMFAPLWFLSSTAYQAALCFDDVAFVTLISSSSSLFVLIFGIISPKRPSDRFSWTKLGLVLMNLISVGFVSELTGTGLGLFLALVSAFCYAAFLHTFSSMTGTRGKVDRFLMFGTIGLFSVFACTPLILAAHATKLEPQLPWPTREELGLVIVNGLVGSIFADYLWIWATELTSSLISSLSLTLSIPLSFVADSLFRGTPPSPAQIIASFPIMASFVGAALIQNRNSSSQAVERTKVKFTSRTSAADGDSESATLITDDDNL
uniref:Solute carrier family 35 member F5 n=1 Tax=Panagrellus redivivus TaxID=6233 RepID=A0A7E4ZZ91_PANRE